MTPIRLFTPYHPLSFNHGLSVFALFSLMALISCKKEPASIYWGTNSSSKNGSEWSGKIRANKNPFSDTKVDISITRFDDEDIPLDNIVFFKIPLAKSAYHLSNILNQAPDGNQVGAYYFNGYDDELYDTYVIAADDSTSYIELTDYDSNKGEVRGRFQVKFVIDSKGSLNAPDSVVFSDGVFHTRIAD